MFLTMFAVLAALTIQVKPGDDLAEVRDRIREERKTGESAEVVFADGVYVVEKAIELEPWDSNIVFRAEHPGKAVLQGGYAFRLSDAEQRAKGVRAYKLTKAQSERVRDTSGLDRGLGGRRIDFSVGDAWGTWARWPNEDEPGISLAATNFLAVGKPIRLPHPNPKLAAKGATVPGTTSSILKVAGGRPGTWNWEDVTIRAFTKFWGDFKIDRWDSVSNAVVATPSGHGTFKLCPHATRTTYFMGVLEEIDRPGEWCVDHRRGELCFLPPEGAKPDDLCLIHTSDEPFFRVTCRRDKKEIVTARCRNVRIEGLVFFGGFGSASVDIDEGANIAVEGCRFGFVRTAYRGVGLGLRLVSCDIDHTRRTAVFMDGGNVRTIEPGNCVVENCHIRNCGYANIGGSRNDTLVLRGCRNAARHNLIHDLSWIGLDYGGTGCIVEYNRIYNACINDEQADTGALYAGGEPSVWGGIVRYNDVGCSSGYKNCIYLDDLTSGQTVYGNIARNFGFYGLFVGGGSCNVISNNIVTAGWGGIHLDNRGQYWPGWSDRSKCIEKWIGKYGITNGPYASAYPQWSELVKKDFKKLYPWGNVFKCNVIVDLVSTEHGNPTDYQEFREKIPNDYNPASDNLYVRTAGSSNPTNNHTAVKFWRFGGIRLLDGEREKPVDLGFVNIPKQEKKEGAKWGEFVFEKGDFNLKPDARLLKELPGFAPIPFDKIGLYKDKWRKRVP